MSAPATTLQPSGTTAAPYEAAAPDPRASVKQVYRGILETMRAVGAVGIRKGKEMDLGQGKKQKYRSIDDVYDNLNGALVEAGLIILPSVQDLDYKRYEVEKSGNSGKYMQVTYAILLTVKYRIVSIFDGSEVELDIRSEAFDNSDKGIGKAMSYAYKMLCLQLFCIPIEGNAENENDNIPRPESQQSKSERTNGNAPAARTLVSNLKERAATSDRPDTRPARKVETPDLKHPTVKTPPFIVLRKHARYGEGETPISVFNDAELCDYVRQLVHVRDAAAAKVGNGDEQAKSLHQAAIVFVAHATTWAQLARGITDFSKRAQDRTAQLAAAVAGKEDDKLELSDEMHMCENHGMYGGDVSPDIRTWISAEKVLEYIGWLNSMYNQPTKAARIMAAERCVEKITKAEADAAERALAKK